MATAAKTQSLKRNLDSFRDGRDEMNLVEFPFATLSERSGESKVLEFQVDELAWREPRKGWGPLEQNV